MVPNHVCANPTAVLYTEDCRTTYDEFLARGVEFSEPPQPKPLGLQAIFNDLCGNRYALLEPGAAARPEM